MGYPRIIMEESLKGESSSHPPPNAEKGGNQESLTEKTSYEYIGV